MELSEHERRVLSEIEAGMAAENPRLASTLGKATLGKTTRIRPTLNAPRVTRTSVRVGLYVLALVVGVVLLSVGLGLNDDLGTALGVAGCALIVAGVSTVLSYSRASSDWRRPDRGEAGRWAPKGRAPRR